MEHAALLLIAAHMIGDYVAQTNWMAAHKFTDWRVRTVHVVCYTACFAVALALVQPGWHAAAWFLGGLFSLHWLTDCRRWASPDPWPPKPIMVDQSLHAAQIAVLAWLFLYGGGR